MAQTHGGEEYLEAIYVLTVEGEMCTGARIAEYVGVSPVSVSRALNRLERDGHIAARQPQVRLTDAGWRTAEAVVRRHRLAERWLADTLGLDWVEAHREAGRLEHALSPRVEQALWEDLGRPRTCPHGNPIPGLAGELPPAERLTRARGDRLQVVRIFEQLEGLEDRLVFLQRHGLMPGAWLSVLERGDDELVVAVDGQREVARLPYGVADKILVAAGEGGPKT
jgi:DtxR family Mn-dependent transcriptional regulator